MCVPSKQKSEQKIRSDERIKASRDEERGCNGGGNSGSVESVVYPASVFITGADRGIGFGLVQQFLNIKTVEHVIAGALDPDTSKDLHGISDDRLHVVKIDVEDDQSIVDACAQVEEIVGERGLNLLVNNAGVLPTYFTSGTISRKKLAKCLNVNVMGTIIVSQTFLPLLKKASAHVSDDHWGIDRAAIVNISSYWGSISRNEDGSGELGALAYRISKAGVNQLGKTMATDLATDKIIVTQFCPGWVRTAMGNMEGRKATLTVEESTSALVNSMSKLRKQHSGGFFTRHLKPIPY
ncbi:unnamed protein product [Cylicocyclus nassatus]|uniref:Uncharacterized protein n=1 Tax=Cylicocyclus nassatus TaxID=53992 RepID=A0AA36GZQ7_CYLNA|nr:unnamed protein product [Cylicocyclus nassatus]